MSIPSHSLTACPCLGCSEVRVAAARPQGEVLAEIRARDELEAKIEKLTAEKAQLAAELAQARAELRRLDAQLRRAGR